MKFNRKYLFFPALAVGVVILFLAIKMRPDLPSTPAGDRARLVETQRMELKPIAPEVIGFGHVSPKVEWKAIAEVTGKVVYRHPELEKGQILAAGTEVLRIDPLDYELKLAQAQADLASSQTSLQKITQQEDNLKQSLAIEKNRLDITQLELERKRNLQQRGLTSQSDVDQQQQNVLSQKKLLQDIENQIALLPDEKRVAQAVVRVSESKLEEAERSLSRTKITLPQALRVADVEIEKDQVVNLQQTMFTAHGIDVMEVEAQLSIHDMQIVINSLEQFERSASGIPQSESTNVRAQISLNSGNLSAQWPAKVSRVSESVDSAQATVGVILEVEQDYSVLQPGSSPALTNGMFVKATIEGQATPNWVIPERALHGDRAYLMDEEDRLKFMPVKVLYRRNNQVVVSGEFEVGDKLVLNDVLPAIEGMLLREEVEEQAQ
ncbi:efflux RND transporter periplasmic adaptor subunit [Vibrio agarivorans]|uniref:efflux RND transporter periplasmic adaptor subunit n=1 Tax=Vibrio agarivorans TaxID=153622 RepID=UPI0025B52F06|nr:HlyD family efflux transporter periplasmic adaptor subunit [Vibrio agarivorans]MDN3661617.1 HlyD family secretion protein [Vibrio agarivorans]